MGAYLSTPLTEKESTDEINKYLSCGASQMQGWRMSQEDAHICSLDYDKSTSLFAVFDGHGGAEVALYCSKKLPDFLKNTDAYKQGDYEQALKDAFLGFDATLVNEEIIGELRELMPTIKGDGETETEEDGEAEDDEEDLAELCQESRMPLDKLLEKYKDATTQFKKNEASGSKPASPALRGRRILSNGQNPTESSDSAQNDANENETTVVTERKIEISVTEEEEETVSSSSTSAGACSKNDQTNEASCSIVTASESGSTSTEQTSATSSLKSEKPEVTTNDTSSDGINNHGPSSSSSSSGSNGGNKSDAEKIFCNSPDSSSTAKKNPENVKETAGSSCSAGSSSDTAASVNGSENKTISKHIHIESEVNEVTTISSKGDSVTSSSTSVVTIENGVGSSNSADADKSQNKISSTNNRKAKSMPVMSNNSSSDDDEEDDEDGSYNEDRSSAEEEEGDVEDSEGVEEGEEEEEDTEDEGVSQNEFDEDEKFLNNMYEGPGSSSGCTAVMALLHGNQLYVANAGDSRCVVCRDGKALEMSLDHKPEDNEELLRIRKAGGRVTLDGRVNGGLNLSRAIGDHAYKTNKELKPEQQMISALPDIKKITVSPKDEFMVLACDGIWNSLSSEEVVDFIRTRIVKGETKMSAICEELFSECLAPNTCGDGTGCDNMTAVIVQFKPSLLEEYSKNDLNASMDVTTSTSTAKKRAASPSTEADDGLSNNDSTKRPKTDANDVNNVVEPTTT